MKKVKDFLSRCFEDATSTELLAVSFVVGVVLTMVVISFILL